jgi:hypothetical protein
MTQGNGHPRRLRRAESFLGIHFDFHAGDDCTQIGKNTTREMLEQIIEQVHPDYIQCDCKGHRGLSSYPTKVGYPAPGFVRDNLRLWREVTVERGVALYMHYSGVWDTEALRHHPSWARIDEQGKRDKNNTSVFGPYVDRLLIPQLAELASDYGVDGAWVDGECWATVPDYGRKVLEAFRRDTGIREVPRKPEDAHFFEFLEFCREGFRRYLRHYVTELHRRYPSFQIASNWAYTSFMPEPVGIAVDYISGDYTPQNSVNSARLEARCIAPQGKPWDLMAWSFSAKWGEGGWSTKSIPQLKQEAAIVLALGGGFQAYFQQKRDGSIGPWQMKLMAEVARFCRARQKVCHHAKPVPQIALLYPGAAFYRRNPRLFAPWTGLLVPMQGILQSLLESQYSVEVLMEHHLKRRLGEYPLVIIPEWDCLESSFREDLLGYVRDGGSLLAIGPRAAALFEKELKVRLAGEVREDACLWLEHGRWLGALKTPWQAVELLDGARPFGRLFHENDVIGPSEVAATIASCGKGQIAGLYLNYGERYIHEATNTARGFLAALVEELFPRPLVSVAGSHHVDVTVNRIDGKLAVNLVNTAGPHANPQVYVFDDIPPVGPLQIAIRSAARPARVTLEPAGTPLAYTYADGEVRLTLPRLEIHDVIVVA